MTTRRTRRTLAPLSSLVPLALCAALLVGCGNDDPDPEAGTDDPASETTTASPTDDATTAPTDSTEPTEPGETETDGVPEPTTPVGPEETDGPLPPSEGPDEPVPADAEELCAAFDDAIKALTATGNDIPTDDEPLPDELREALQTWGQDLADADLPADLTDDQAAGIAVMSRLLLAIPDDATGDDLESLEDDLNPAEDRQVEAAGDYVGETCQSAGF